MLELPELPAAKAELYEDLRAEVTGYLKADTSWLANLANVSALLYYSLADINWCGFYLLTTPDELTLGPFGGKPACTRIKLGEGVCGTAAARQQTLVVPDVDQFPGHIACDSASRSEIVVPLLVGDRVTGVLDVDSPSLDRFDDQDQQGLEAIAAIITEQLDWANAPVSAPSQL